jgi:hypothetical protein
MHRLGRPGAGANHVSENPAKRGLCRELCRQSFRKSSRQSCQILERPEQRSEAGLNGDSAQATGPASKMRAYQYGRISEADTPAGIVVDGHPDDAPEGTGVGSVTVHGHLTP